MSLIWREIDMIQMEMNQNKKKKNRRRKGNPMRIQFNRSRYLQGTTDQKKNKKKNVLNYRIQECRA